MRLTQNETLVDSWLRLAELCCRCIDPGINCSYGTQTPPLGKGLSFVFHFAASPSLGRSPVQSLPALHVLRGILQESDEAGGKEQESTDARSGSAMRGNDSDGGNGL